MENLGVSGPARATERAGRACRGPTPKTAARSHHPRPLHTLSSRPANRPPPPGAFVGLVALRRCRSPELQFSLAWGVWEKVAFVLRSPAGVICLEIAIEERICDPRCLQRYMSTDVEGMRPSGVADTIYISFTWHRQPRIGRCTTPASHAGRRTREAVCDGAGDRFAWPSYALSRSLVISSFASLVKKLW